MRRLVDRLESCSSFHHHDATASALDCVVAASENAFGPSMLEPDLLAQ
jgi:hypothetical protein